MRTHTGHFCRLWKLCWFLSFGMYRVVPSIAHKGLQSDLEHTVNQVETLTCLTGKKPPWEILAVWIILCGTLHVLLSWLDILMELLYFRRFRRNAMSTQTKMCSVEAVSPQDILRPCSASNTWMLIFFHCVATAFSTDQFEGMACCGEHRNFPSGFALSSRTG